MVLSSVLLNCEVAVRRMECSVPPGGRQARGRKGAASGTALAFALTASQQNRRGKQACEAPA